MALLRVGLPDVRRCRRTGGLLPRHFTVTALLCRTAVYFLLQRPSRHRELRVTEHPALWSPDFPLHAEPAGTERSPGILWIKEQNCPPVICSRYHAKMYKITECITIFFQISQKWPVDCACFLSTEHLRPL